MRYTTQGGWYGVRVWVVFTMSLPLFVGITSSSIASGVKHLKHFEEVAPGDAGARIVPASGSEGEVQTQSVVRYRLDAPYNTFATLRGEAGKYMVGLMRHEWGIDVTTWKNDWLPDGLRHFEYGYVRGSNTNYVDGCLWVAATLVATGSAPTFDCRTWNNVDLAPPSRYMQFFNGNVPGVNCSAPGDPHRYCDGTEQQISPGNCPGGAPAHPNVRPWVPGGEVATPLYTIPARAIVRWRYVTLDGRFIAVRYPGPSRPYGQDWWFIPRHCIHESGLHPRYAPEG